MNRLTLSALSLVSLGLLAACETTGSRPPPVGASVQDLEPGRFRATYRGTSRMSEAEVRDRGLLQAAEMTLARGYDWFRVIDRFNDVAPPTRPRFSFGLGVGSYGRGGGADVGGSTGFGGEATSVVTLEVMAGKGQPPGTPDVYDARAVASTLGPRLPPRG